MDLETKYEAVRTSLKNMYRKDGFLNICTIDKCIKILGVVVDSDTYNMLSVLHCVHFGDMSKDLRSKVIQAIMDTFHVDNIMVEAEFLELIGKAEVAVPRLQTFAEFVEDQEEDEKPRRRRLFGLIRDAS